MTNLNQRLNRIEEKMGTGPGTCLLVCGLPGRPVAYGNRTFESVEVAVETLQREQGRTLVPRILEIVYVSSREERED